MRLRPGKTKSPAADSPSGERSGGHTLTVGQIEARRAALDAQKRYMDDRFGRNRVMGRRRPA